MLVDIDKIVVGDRIRKDFGDIDELAEDIRQNGLINPPVVNRDYVLLAGERRLRACRSLGWQQIEVRMMDTRDAEHELNVEISENDVRKGFTKSERVDYMRRLLRIEQAKAKDNMAAGGEGREISHTLRSDESTAQQFGISSNTMRREMAIVDHADLLDPSDFADWDEGRLSTNKAFQRIKAAQKQAERERDEAESDAAELRRKLSDMRDEVAALEEQNGQLHELTRQQQVVTREVTVEVIPDDYEDLQKSVRELETANRMFSETNHELQRQLEQAGEEASANLLNSAKRELLAFVIKYEQLNELADVIAVAKALLGES